jgi:hypothetical protein
MSSNLNLDLNGKHVVGAAAVWKSPELLNIVIGNVWKIVLFMTLMGGINAWVQDQKNSLETSAVKRQGFERLVQKCKVGQLQKYGRYDSLSCKKWANAYYPVYEM